MVNSTAYTDSSSTSGASIPDSRQLLRWKLNSRAKFLLILSLLLVARLTILIRRRSGTEFIAIDEFALLQIAIVGITWLMLLTLPRVQTVWSGIRGTSARALILYYAICILSTLWSPLKSYTLYRAVEYLSQILAIFVVFSYFTDWENAEKRLLLWGLICLILNFGVNVKMAGGLPLSIRSAHTNTYSATAAMLFCYCLGEYLEHSQAGKRHLIRYGMLGLFFLIVGTSSASYIATLIGMAVIGMMSRKRWLIIMVGALALPGLFLMSPNDWMHLLFPGKTDQALMTLSGREYFWTMYLNRILESPIIGHGFAVSARLNAYYTTNTHNGLMAVLLGTGALGGIIILGGCLRFIRECAWNLVRHRPGTVGCIGALVAGTANNMSISIVGETWIAPSFTFICFLAYHLFLIGRLGWQNNQGHPQQPDPSGGHHDR